MESGPTRKQIVIAANTTLGAVMPLYVIISYATVDVQKAIRNIGGLRQLLVSWGPVYDVAEAAVLGAVSILLGTALFLLMSRQLGTPKLVRGLLAASPLLVAGSALGRYLLNPDAPMPGLISVILTILASEVLAMYAATKFQPTDTSR